MNDMVSEMSDKLETIADDCFPMRKITKKSTDKPWFTKRIGSVLRRRDRIYFDEGKSERWRQAALYAKDEVRKAKVRHMEKVKKKRLRRQSWRITIQEPTLGL